jgi:hypothetical protein
MDKLQRNLPQNRPELVENLSIPGLVLNGIAALVREIERGEVN